MNNPSRNTQSPTQPNGTKAGKHAAKPKISISNTKSIRMTLRQYCRRDDNTVAVENCDDDDYAVP